MIEEFRYWENYDKKQQEQIIEDHVPIKLKEAERWLKYLPEK